MMRVLVDYRVIVASPTLLTTYTDVPYVSHIQTVSAKQEGT